MTMLPLRPSSRTVACSLTDPAEYVGAAGRASACPTELPGGSLLGHRRQQRRIVIGPQTINVSCRNPGGGSRMVAAILTATPQ